MNDFHLLSIKEVIQIKFSASSLKRKTYSNYKNSNNIHSFVQQIFKVPMCQTLFCDLRHTAVTNSFPSESIYYQGETF